MAKQRKRNLAPTTTSPAKMGEEMAHAQAVSAQSPNVKYVGKHGPTGAQEPATAGHRTGHQERLGATYAPQMPLYEANAPEAGLNQRNVRVVPSAIGNRDFYLRRQYGQNS